MSAVPRVLPRMGRLLSGRTLLLPLEALFPECPPLIRPHPRLRPFACLRDGGCHLGQNTRCMETLARRLGRLFERHARLEQVLLHWEEPGGATWGVAFDRAFGNPRVARLRGAYLEHYLAAGEPFLVPDEVLA